jgi:UDP-N-acetylmuramate--alanine ligase
MNIKDFKNIYFVGIGGIGMSALARYALNIGMPVAGYDKTPSLITDALQKEGAFIAFDDAVDKIPESFLNKAETLIVYTPAIPSSHRGLQWLNKNGFTVIKRAKALGLIANAQKGIAVAGTHGKTSVSSGVACIMHESSLGCNAFLGGITQNYQTNHLLSHKAAHVVVEADEFDRSFLHLTPQIAVLTAMDADHLDIYGDAAKIHEAFEAFIAQIEPGGTLIAKKGLPVNESVNPKIQYLSYSLEEKADYYAENIEVKDGYYHFTLNTPTAIIKDIRLGVPGLYNLENAIASAAAAFEAGVTGEEIRNGLKVYKGVKRRFDVKIREQNLVLIDDYAHHPEEIKACIASVRHLFPGKKITGVFQPHLFSRTRDFAEGFAQSLSACDQVYLTHIYPAREEPIEGVNSELVFKDISISAKEIVPYGKLVDSVARNHFEVIVVMGAGDIDRLVLPLKEKLLADEKN